MSSDDEGSPRAGMGMDGMKRESGTHLIFESFLGQSALPFVFDPLLFESLMGRKGNRDCRGKARKEFSGSSEEE